MCQSQLIVSSARVKRYLGDTNCCTRSSMIASALYARVLWSSSTKKSEEGDHDIKQMYDMIQSGFFQPDNIIVSTDTYNFSK